MAISLVLSAIHVLNFLNFTFVGPYFRPPLTRSLLLVITVLALLATSAANFRTHLVRSWDMYGICTLALLSVAYSMEPAETLKYASWLLLSVYLGTELATRLRTTHDMVVALAIVMVPIGILVAFVNLTMGPVVLDTGRQFGALGSRHIDAAIALDSICLFLALRAVPVRIPALPKWLSLLMLGVVAWSLKMAVFALTRSVWLGVILAGGLYYFRRRLTFGGLAGALVTLLLVIMVLDFIGADRFLPEAVKGRIEVTEQRYESGEIDPRLEGIQYAFEYALQNPEGTGYAVASSHNSYMNMLLNLGWLGFALTFVAVGRSMRNVLKAGFPWAMFFAIGSAPLLLHAFFEVQSMPGQANFIPLLVWYALSRSTYLMELVSAPRRRRRSLVR